MKFNKNNFLQSFLKITVFTLIISNTFAQNAPTGNGGGPATGPISPANTTGAPIGTKGNPGNTPQTSNTQQNGTQQTGSNNRNVSNDPNSSRNLQLSAADLASMAREDSLKSVRESELEKDASRAALRKRIFGYNLFNTTRFDPTPALNIATPSNYVLGPNDQLVIDIYGYSQANYKTVISPDGYITLDRVGLIYLAGSSMEQAREKIMARMAKVYTGLKSYEGFPPNTHLIVSLGNIRSIKVTVTGEVVAPGTYTLSSLSSILNALYACGGPNELGTFRKINLIRNNRIVASLDLYEVLIKGFAKDNIILQDQDIIQISPFISRIAVSGNTKRNGLFELTENEKLSDLISYAGGFNPYAYRHRIKVHRNTSRERKILDVLEADFNTFSIMSGDSVITERLLERYENMVKIQGSVFRPGEYSLDSNPTLMQLVKSAEGLRGEALTGRIAISRTREDMIIENISLNLDDIIKGKSADVVLKREDVVTIPSVFDLTEPAYIRIQGAINNPDGQGGIEIPYVRNLTIEDVLVKVGGLSESASLSRVEVVRRKRNVDPTSTSAQISDTFQFNIRPDLSVETAGTSFILYPFDEIFIRKSPNYVSQSFVSVEGEVLFPARYGIKNKDEKISDAIARAGGLTPQSYIEGATLIRTIQLSDVELEQRRKTISEIANSAGNNQRIEIEADSSTKKSSIGIDLKKIIENPGSNADMILQDGDIIRIPKRLETVRIQGEVLYPTTIKYINRETFMNYVSKAGGFTKKSLKSKSYILYANGSVDRTRRFFFVNIYPKVEPGSEIIIPQRNLTAQQQLSQLQGFLTAIGATMTTVVTILGIISLSK
ncbi:MULTISPECIES: SLBB domain-containing protein [Emticicia]|uniref:SLBB domain-containing protein n=1 Tax=Emticicia TaxID=312278 RepID=UPI00209F2F2C|nr:MULTISPECIES: SLBB domain-containing protein [Emticicia]UTA70151.1 SLBB domain-containing protein [Emticicia sp. 21SJ11W-3]